jgi:hypothetical protein
MLTKNRLLWIIWLLVTAALAGWLVLTMLDTGAADKTMFLPGSTTAGHHQIEQVCTACHSESFADQDAVQAACVGCHGDQLKAAKDDHPKSKFTDPRNADRLAQLDARYCVTCHVEHRPAITHEMGVTIPADTCYLCHSEIAEDRPSHSDMAFDTCTSAGCHNFHDNRALYEDFLLKHADQPDNLAQQALLTSNLIDIAEQLPDYPLAAHPLAPTALEQQQIPEQAISARVMEEWQHSSHAAAGVNCSGCHQGDASGSANWVERPDHSACSSCHKGEVEGFLLGKHGMRLNAAVLGRELGPMTPALARLPMKPATHQQPLGCQSCHAAHTYDSQSAAVSACLNCHDDEHSLAYLGSPHHRLWEDEQQGAVAGSGVSCASCHMPREEKDYYWGTFTHNQVQHNQSANLKPNEKMLRSVCMNCHGLGFAIDALADRNLIRNNFSGPPGVHVPGIDLAVKRANALEKSGD